MTTKLCEKPKSRLKAMIEDDDEDDDDSGAVGNQKCQEQHGSHVAASGAGDVDSGFR